MPAWLGSALLHAAIFVLLGIAWRNLPSHGQPGGDPERPAGIALVDLNRTTPEYYLEATDSTSQRSDASSDASSTALPSSNATAVAADAAPALPTSQDLGPLPGAAAGLPDPRSLTSSGQPSRGVGGKTTTSVFGASGTGSRFVYVFDRSSSMDGFGGRPLVAAKQQLLASLEGLQDIHQFQIVFYNERPSVFNPNAPQPPRLLFADPQGKRLAERFVQGISATGGTKHWEAIKLAIDMKPDVIFFLTDGSENPLSPNQLDTIQRQAERAGTTIHSIEFGGGPATGRYNFLARLAQQNRGQYVYVDVTRLNP